MNIAKVVHSQSKAAFNVVGTKAGAKYKLARIPYEVHKNDKELNKREYDEALDHANFIALCFNNRGNQKPIQQKRYFYITYIFDSKFRSTGTGQECIVVEDGNYINLAYTVKTIQENNPTFKSVLVTNISELNEKDYEHFIA